MSRFDEPTSTGPAPTSASEEMRYGPLRARGSQKKPQSIARINIATGARTSGARASMAVLSRLVRVDPETEATAATAAAADLASFIAYQRASTTKSDSKPDSLLRGEAGVPASQVHAACEFAFQDRAPTSLKASASWSPLIDILVQGQRVLIKAALIAC